MAQAFHSKYRPTSLSDYMGDTIRSTILTRFKDPETYPHTILLYGTMGSGKTTLARLIAQEFHCLDKIDGHACGKCENCRAIQENYIAQGQEVYGISELDIATEGGKAQISEFLEDAVEPPIYPYKYKVVILDECHKASDAAQNRLLKITEEPPKHLIFIFCTTEPEAMLSTLVSRCQLKLEIKPAKLEDLTHRLQYVCQQEGIKTSIKALEAIANKANRIPREALNLLESLSITYGKNVTGEAIRAEFGEVSSKRFVDFYIAANGGLEAIMAYMHTLADSGVTYGKFLDELTGFTLDCINVKYGFNTEAYTVALIKDAVQLFKPYNATQIDTLCLILEQAYKSATGSETRARLAVLNTANRIGKLQMYDIGAGSVDADNLKSVSNYTQDTEAQEEAKRQRAVKKIALDTETIGTLLGKAELSIVQTSGVMGEVQKAADEISDEELADEQYLMDEFKL